VGVVREPLIALSPAAPLRVRRVSEHDSPAVPARLAGGALAALIAAIGTVRGPRPIHTTGLLLTGTLRWRPRSAVRSGIAWIDERPGGDVPVRARLSRGAALPAALPDVIGLAVRVGDGEGDLLLSSTGTGVPGRFLLRPRRTPAGATLSTLMPYRGTAGPVLLAARTRAPAALPARMERIRATLHATPWVLDLGFAGLTGPWHRFGGLELTPTPGPIDSADLRFDPVLHPPEGAGTYPWTRVLREPAYAVGRRDSRGAA
jgi:hypothetical protein